MNNTAGRYPGTPMLLLSGSFATWQLPDKVVYLDALPRTSVGKLDKKAMRAAYADIYRG